MKIEKIKLYRMYLTDEEVDLLDEICSEHTHICYVYSNGYWKLELMGIIKIKEILNLLEKEFYRQLDEENNKNYAIEIKTLIDNIKRELF